MRGGAGAGRVLEEADDLDADEDAVGGEVRGLAGTFEAVDDEVVGLDGEVPEVEVNRAELDLAAGGVLEDADNFLADAVLEVGGGRVPGEAAEEDQHEQDETACEPGDAAEDLDGESARLGGLILFRFAHGATSSGLIMRTEPWALSWRSQSERRAPTRCWRSTS